MDVLAHIATFRKRFAEVEQALSDPNVFADQKRGSELAKEHARLKETLAAADEHAKAKGHTYVIGTAAKSNEAGIKSCLAEGFEIVAVEQLGDEIVGIQLRKDL